MDRFSTYDEFLNEALDPSRFLTQEQIDWCDRHIDGSWGVNGKGEVTVPLHVKFKDKSFQRFPVQFAPVKGDFWCSGCPKLLSLEGAPAHVGRDFSCKGCPKLTSLEGAPAHVEEDFLCENCPKLTSLKGAPAHVGGRFDCERCRKLTSLEGAPAHVSGSFNCVGCPQLASLEGAPAHVVGYFLCGGCPKLPDSFVGIIKDYMDKRIDWKMAHKLIHSETGRKAHSIGLI